MKRLELLKWFDTGLTKEEYLSGMKVNKEEMNKIYTQFSLNPGEKETIQKIKNLGWKTIVLTEDWCGDALLNNPVLLRIAEEANIDVRFVLRDRNLELMDQYLTNGTSRSIPIFIFIDEKGEEKAVWGPRAAEGQAIVNEGLKGLPEKDHPEFADKQKQLFKQFRERYQQDEELWHVVADSILVKLTAAI